MKKVICFSTNTRNIEVLVELNENNLTIKGSIFLISDLDKPYNWGQCEDSIKELIPRDRKFAEIYAIWKEYHLNDMRPGTPKQTEALRSFKASECFRSDYAQKCDYLESLGLLNDDSHIYGSRWLRIEIPESVIEIIKSW